MFIPPYALHRDPRYFSPMPDEFWPERWLVADGLLPAPVGFAHSPNALLAFSHGPANCVGKNLALMEIHMVVCGIVQ